MDSKNCKETTFWPKSYWPPTILFVSAFIVAALFGKHENALLRQLGGAFFGYALGLSMILWARVDWIEGKTKGKHRSYTKDDNPKMFLLIMIFKMGIPALCGIAIGIYHTFLYQG